MKITIVINNNSKKTDQVDLKLLNVSFSLLQKGVNFFKKILFKLETRIFLTEQMMLVARTQRQKSKRKRKTFGGKKKEKREGKNGNVLPTIDKPPAVHGR